MRRYCSSSAALSAPITQKDSNLLRYMEQPNSRAQHQEVRYANLLYTAAGLTRIVLGIGAYKLAANYAPGVMIQKEAAKKGYVQNLWLYGPEHQITEVTRSHKTCIVRTDPCSRLISGGHDECICCFQAPRWRYVLSLHLRVHFRQHRRLIPCYIILQLPSL